jgi:hypothetical protein
MHLHLLSFTIPYPPDYGGVIDVWEKIRALHAEGVYVHLHCFEYNRARAPELEAFCASVHYYRRGPVFTGIVFSRRSTALLEVLDRDDYPILAEGIHTSWALTQGRWPGRKLAMRLHNVEALYYRGLARSERNILKRIFFLFESSLLTGWEKKVSGLPLLAIHPGIGQYFREHYGSRDALYLPAFTSYAAGRNPLGRGGYVRFHGDLSVADNRRALEWLLKHVRRGYTPWVVAGRRPGGVKIPDGVTLEADPTDERMEALIQGAQVNLIHSFNPTGIKIKLLHALFAGRHCIAHTSLLEGTGLGETCLAAGDAEAFRTQLDLVWSIPFTEADRDKRTRILGAQFDNKVNARKLIKLLES